MKASSLSAAIIAALSGGYIYETSLTALSVRDWTSTGLVTQFLGGLIVAIVCFIIGSDSRAMVGSVTAKFQKERVSNMIAVLFGIFAVLGILQAFGWRHCFQTILLGVTAVMVATGISFLVEVSVSAIFERQPVSEESVNNEE